MRIYFGTVIRNAPVNSGGALAELDWETKTLRRETAIYPQDPDLSHDSNPRGNGRGCRGLCISDGQVVAANYHSLLFFNRDLSLEHTVSHGLMAGLHEVCLDSENTVWVTSTALDSVLRFDLGTGELKDAYWPREMSGLQRELGLAPFPVNKEADNRERYLNRNLDEDSCHLHVNAVAVWRGQVYGLFNRYGVIANLSTDEVIIKDAALRGAHNLVINEQGIAFSNDTLGRAVMLFDLSTGEVTERIDLLDYKWMRSLLKRARRKAKVRNLLYKCGLAAARPGRALFVRGLALHENSLFLGMSPASIIEIDWKTREFVSAYQLSDNLDDCIHGLLIAPEAA